MKIEATIRIPNHQYGSTVANAFVTETVYVVESWQRSRSRSSKAHMDHLSTLGKLL